MIDEENYKERFEFLIREYQEKGSAFIKQNQEKIKRFIDKYETAGGRENALAGRTLKLALENLK